MDVNILRTLITAAGFVAFVAIVLWAYGRGRRERFAQAARLPLDDDGDRATTASRGEGALR